MERVGTGPTVADQSMCFDENQPSLAIGQPYEELGFKISTRSKLLGPIEPPANRRQLPDEYQYSLPVESQFDGFVFRTSTRDPKSVGLATPIDEITGLPLPILISDAGPVNANRKFWDYHHHYHPEKDLINADDAALALRRSRGQYLPRWLHEHYHKFFAGPELPETRQEVFASVVLACAGVVPRKVIEFSRNEGPKIVEVGDEASYAEVVRSIKHEGEKDSPSSSFHRSEIGIFFANYALEQSFENVVSKKVINKFLKSDDPAERKILGNLMLREAIHLSVEPVIPIHRSLEHEGVARKRKTDLRSTIRDFFVRSRQQDYYKAIDQKLRVA